MSILILRIGGWKENEIDPQNNSGWNWNIWNILN